MSIIVSICFYFIFALIYNGVCVDCLGSTSVPYWVIQHSMGTMHFWSICLLAAVLAVLPRIALKTLRNTMRPTDTVRVMQASAAVNAVGPKSGSAASHLANQGDGVGALGIGDDDSQYSRNAQMRKSSSRSTSQSSVLR